eukprot:329926-Prorocentrum_lima.AAC.1
MLLAAKCHEKFLLHEYRGICEHTVNMGVYVMYVLGKDLLDYDLNNLLVLEDRHTLTAVSQ